MVSIDLRALADGLRLHSIGSLVAFTCALDSLLDSMRHSMVSPAMNRTQQRELVELLNFLLGKRARLGIMAAAAPGVSNWPAQKAFIIQVFEWNDTGTVSQLQFTKDLKSYQMLAAMHRNDTTAIADFAWDEFGGGNGRGGNGRGGNGRGGNNTRKCYNCGQAGHISRDCRVNGGGKGGGGKGPGGKGGRTCYNCGQVGHISAACPNRNQPPAQNAAPGGGANAGAGVGP